MSAALRRGPSWMSQVVAIAKRLAMVGGRLVTFLVGILVLLEILHVAGAF